MESKRIGTNELIQKIEVESQMQGKKKKKKKPTRGKGARKINQEIGIDMH